MNGLDTLIDQLQQQSATQWIALLTGVIYVVLAARQNIACWIFGIISCACIAWDDFAQYKLYSDGVLQIIYILFGLYGLQQWHAAEERDATFTIRRHNARRHFAAITGTALVSIPFAYLLSNYTDAALSYLDTLTTLLSLYATWLLTQRILENWLYWIVVDVVYIYLFAVRGGLLVAVLYLIFALVAIYGYTSWSHQDRHMPTKAVD